MKGDPSNSLREQKAAAESGQTVLDWAREAGESERVIRDLDKYLRRGRIRKLRAAAAVAILLLAAGSLWQARKPKPAAAASSPGGNAIVISPETRRLPDGSILELKSGAEIAVDFGGAVRRVVLQKGEVFFHVAKDAKRPFAVEANGVEVRAVGTAFSVQLRPSAVAVLVTEGRVAVNQSATGPAPGHSPWSDPGTITVAMADAGDRVVVDLARPPAGSPPVSALPPDQMKDLLSWRIPRLEFAGTPLAEAIPMLNRYCGVKLALGNPALGRLKLSGTLRADNSAPVLQLLQGEFGVITEQRDGEIVLYPPVGR